MKKAAKWVIIAVVVLAVVICVSTSVYTVSENEYACVVRFEKIVSTTDTPGLHLRCRLLMESNGSPRPLCCMIFHRLRC